MGSCICYWNICVDVLYKWIWLVSTGYISQNTSYMGWWSVNSAIQITSRYLVLITGWPQVRVFPALSVQMEIGDRNWHKDHCSLGGFAKPYLSRLYTIWTDKGLEHSSCDVQINWKSVCENLHALPATFPRKPCYGLLLPPDKQLCSVLG